MEYLSRDPIIDAYFNFRKANEDDVPVFSETVLRLAIKHVLQYKNQGEDGLLGMYKMLLTIMLYFNSDKTLDELEDIMICYSRGEVKKILEDRENIEDSWKLFTVEEMIYFIRKNAFFIIMSEWARRFAYLHKKPAVNDERLGDMTLRIHDYYSWPVKSVHQWKRSFESKFLKGNSKEFDDHDLSNVKETDLTIKNITHDLKDKLHPLIQEDNLKKFVWSIKSVDHEAVHRFQVFKRRRKEDSPKIKIEMHIETDDMKEIGAPTEDDDVEEYVHVLEIEEDDIEDAVNAISVNNDKLSTSNETEKTETDSDCNEQIHENKITKDTNDRNGNCEAEQSSSNDMIDDEQATKYLSALQAYAVVNGLFEAIGLLDQVDSIFRKKFEANI